jgi:hypothetical protein
LTSSSNQLIFPTSFSPRLASFGHVLEDAAMMKSTSFLFS